VGVKEVEKEKEKETRETRIVERILVTILRMFFGAA
jgi:hypothetical protein